MAEEACAGNLQAGFCEEGPLHSRGPLLDGTLGNRVSYLDREWRGGAIGLRAHIQSVDIPSLARARPPTGLRSWRVAGLGDRFARSVPNKPIGRPALPFPPTYRTAVLESDGRRREFCIRIFKPADRTASAARRARGASKGDFRSLLLIMSLDPGSITSAP
jgi:hypothetical protein